MIVYRISKTKYNNDLSGEGARLNGGRWNNENVPCIYAAESRALAALEYTVNTNIDDIPRALSMSIIEIPDDIMYIDIANLPGNWKDSPVPASTKNFGSSLLISNIFPVIRVPSTVIPEEFNYILNPLHQKSNYFKILDIADFIFDVRVKG